jgi:hypothetical protein
MTMLTSFITKVRRTLTGPRRVSSIVKSFERDVADLKHAQAAAEKRESLHLAKANAAFHEGLRAARVRSKLETLIA